MPVPSCVGRILLCLHGAANQGHESVGAKFVAEKLISLAPSHNGFRSPFERFAARGAHTVCGGWMRLTDHAFVLPPKEDKRFRQNKNGLWALRFSRSKNEQYAYKCFFMNGLGAWQRALLYRGPPSPTKDEARRIAANVAKLPGLLSSWAS